MRTPICTRRRSIENTWRWGIRRGPFSPHWRERREDFGISVAGRPTGKSVRVDAGPGCAGARDSGLREPGKNWGRRVSHEDEDGAGELFRRFRGEGADYGSESAAEFPADCG